MMDLFREDMDRMLSYNTKMQVNILDKKLGLTAIFLQLGIVLYIVLYVFVIEEGYLGYEQSKGVATTAVSGDLLAMSSGSTELRYFSADELVYPPLENGNVFVTTKLDVYEQTRGTCEDPSMPCETADDCSKGVGAKCLESGFCEEPSWCSDGPPASYALDTGHFQVWIKTAIQFYQLDREKIFGSAALVPILYPEEGYNTFMVRDLLQKCEPPVRFAEVRELGAAVEVQFVYNCQVEGPIEDCKPEVVARRIDALLDEDDIGFKFAFPEYTSDKTRRLNDVRGIRFYIRTVGTGSMPQLTVVIMMVSTGIALLGFAPVATDQLMLSCFQLSKKYRARKFEESPDFSELADAAEPDAQESANLCGKVEEEEESDSEEDL